MRMIREWTQNEEKVLAQSIDIRRKKKKIEDN